MTRGVAGLKDAGCHLAGQRARSLQQVEGRGKRGCLDGPRPDGEQARLTPIASRQQGVQPADVNSQNGCYPRHRPVTIGSAAEPKSQLAARGHPRQAKRCNGTTCSERRTPFSTGQPPAYRSAVTRAVGRGDAVAACYRPWSNRLVQGAARPRVTPSGRQASRRIAGGTSLAAKGLCPRSPHNCSTRAGATVCRRRTARRP